MKDKVDWVISLALAQNSIKDWKQGEISGFEFSNSVTFRSSFGFSPFILRFNFNYAAGIIYTNNKDIDSHYFMPTDNKLGGECVLVYPVGWKLDPCISAQFNTQLTRSFKYIRGKKISTASLWDPVTSIETFGLELSKANKGDYYTSRLGLSLKQIRASEFTMLTDDFKTRDVKERYKSQTGIQWSNNAKVAITESLTYRGTLSMFGAFEDLTKWTFKMTNKFEIKVFKAIGVTINFDLAYDERQLVGLQYKQNIRFGFIVTPN